MNIKKGMSWDFRKINCGMHNLGPKFPGNLAILPDLNSILFTIYI